MHLVADSQNPSGGLYRELLRNAQEFVLRHIPPVFCVASHPCPQARAASAKTAIALQVSVHFDIDTPYAIPQCRTPYAAQQVSFLGRLPCPAWRVHTQLLRQG